jgi:DNA repair photolyase
VNTLNEFERPFDKPAPLFDRADLLRNIHESIKSRGICTIKLSRYTDIFSPAFVKNGLSYEILKTLCEAEAKRIIITTKGVPSPEIVSLMEKYRQKFSFNLAANPAEGIALEQNIASLDERLHAASIVREKNVQTTIHLDPLIIGINDGTDILENFLRKLAMLKLKRLMFSYLLLSDEIIGQIKDRVGSALTEKIAGCFDQNSLAQHLPNQSDTKYISTKIEIRDQSIARLSSLLKKMGFEFVLCSQKNRHCAGAGDKVTACDGTFYA